MRETMRTRPIRRSAAVCPPSVRVSLAEFREMLRLLTAHGAMRRRFCVPMLQLDVQLPRVEELVQWKGLLQLKTRSAVQLCAYGWRVHRDGCGYAENEHARVGFVSLGHRSAKRRIASRRPFALPPSAVWRHAHRERCIAKQRDAPPAKPRNTIQCSLETGGGAYSKTERRIWAVALERRELKTEAGGNRYRLARWRGELGEAGEGRTIIERMDVEIQTPVKKGVSRRDDKGCVEYGDSVRAGERSAGSVILLDRSSISKWRYRRRDLLLSSAANAPECERKAGRFETWASGMFKIPPIIFKDGMTGSVVVCTGCCRQQRDRTQVTGTNGIDVDAANDLARKRMRGPKLKQQAKESWLKCGMNTSECDHGKHIRFNVQDIVKAEAVQTFGPVALRIFSARLDKLTQNLQLD
ncbi:hypothetical protein C8J57DRAFT_1473506 [Mycena rebaudengoi]|nr:hypothetical protein C8J57DRAFT_1473506 [Mycena rebaudengoi]